MSSLDEKIRQIKKNIVTEFKNANLSSKKVFYINVSKWLTELNLNITLRQLNEIYADAKQEIFEKYNAIIDYYGCDGGSSCVITTYSAFREGFDKFYWGSFVNHTTFWSRCRESLKDVQIGDYPLKNIKTDKNKQLIIKVHKKRNDTLPRDLDINCDGMIIERKRISPLKRLFCCL